MDQIKEFVCYQLICLRRAVSTCWKLFKSHWGRSALLSLVVFVVGVLIHKQIIERWPDLIPFLGSDPMNNIWGHLVYGIFALVCVMGVTMLGLLIVAPFQIYREQNNKIKSQMAPPLNLTFKASDNGIRTRSINLEDVTLTNQSSRKMNLTFRMLIGDAVTEPVKLTGAWHGPGPSSQDGNPRATVDAESSVSGALAFKAQSSCSNIDLIQQNVSLDSCILEISDAISNATIRCKPKHGYPEGKV
jgi:hypothetical protein